METFIGFGLKHLTSANAVSLTAKDISQVTGLLRQCGLPFADCHEHISHFIGVFNEGCLIATGGIEVLGSSGLLRSVAVAAAWRGNGVGDMVVRQLHDQAAQMRIKRLYLLTETAETYFHALGYQALSRKNLPLDITHTQQFVSLCPASAQAMVVDLVPGKF